MRRTKREYDGDGWLSGGNNGIREIRWTSRTGFYLVGGDGRFVPSWFGKSIRNQGARRGASERGAILPGKTRQGAKTVQCVVHHVGRAVHAVLG